MVGIDNPYRLVSVNVMGTVNLLELAQDPEAAAVSSAARPPAPTARRHARRCAGAGCARAGAGTGGRRAGIRPVSTAPPRRRWSPWSRAMRASTAWTASALRLSWIYGPGRTTDCVIRTMLTDALHGRRHTPDGLGPGFHAAVPACRRCCAGHWCWRCSAPSAATPRLHHVTGERYPHPRASLAGIVRRPAARRRYRSRARVRIHWTTDQAQFDTACRPAGPRLHRPR